MRVSGKLKHSGACQHARSEWNAQSLLWWAACTCCAMISHLITGTQQSLQPWKASASGRSCVVATFDTVEKALMRTLLVLLRVELSGFGAICLS